MRKITTLLLLLAMFSSMAACGDKSESSASDSSSVSEIVTEAETEEATTETVTDAPTEDPTESQTEAPTETPTESPTEEPTEETTEEATKAGISTSFDCVTAISEQLDVTDISEMQASSIGAIDGTSFTYNGNKFEVYRFDEEHPTLSSAADGTVTLTVAGWGEYSTNSAVNGCFMMIYSTADDAVIQAFNEIQ